MNNAAHRDNATVAALAVGTSQVCALVAEKDERGGVRVIGVGRHSTVGIRKGEVTSVEGVTNSVEQAVAAAERVCNRAIRSVFLGVGGASLMSHHGRAVIPVSRPDAGISSRDMERALSAARMVAIPAERDVIDVIPQDFSVDDGERVANPEGLHGTRLEARVLVVTARLASVQNLMKSVNQAGLTIEDYIPEPLAVSLAALRAEEQKSGVLLIDLGAGTTTSLCYRDEVLQSLSVFGVGGDHVTNDLSIGLKILQGQAEELKQKAGCAPEAAEETLSLPSGLGRPPLSLPRARVSRIVELRLEEIFSLLRRGQEGNEIIRGLGSGAVLTGGGALLPGVVPLAERVLELPARVGRPRGVTGLAEIIDSPLFAAPVGLVVYGFQAREEGTSRSRESGGPAWWRVKEWLGKYF
jgi:cell division protein FtsA